MAYKQVETLADLLGKYKVIDSRDLVRRLDELESERDTDMETVAEHKARIAELSAVRAPTADPLTDAEMEELENLVSESESVWTTASGEEHTEAWDEDMETEYRTLKDLENELPCDGESLIAESYFEDYARELAEDIGALKDCDHWPANCIDWERAARELQSDYTVLEIQGETYYMRA